MEKADADNISFLKNLNENNNERGIA